MQSTNHILLVRPSAFQYNPETAGSNAFQRQTTSDEKTILKNVLQEFDSFAQKLASRGVDVHVVEDTQAPQKPDAIFPNNWISFHADGKVILYPMFAHNRRLERRAEIIDGLRTDFDVREIIDLSPSEQTNRFLEGTGSIVFDHMNRVAYACVAPRTNVELFTNLAARLGYKPISFAAVDATGQQIYHTNVMMCVGEKFCVVCTDSIPDQVERSKVIESMQSTGHEIVAITLEQMGNFAGNMLELQTAAGFPIIVLSQRAFDCLTPEQNTALVRYAELVPHPIPTIETLGGGSVRCMIAEVFLPMKG